MKTMQDIISAQKKAAKASGRAWWFGPSEARFFDSRIESEAFGSPFYSYYFFVSSEQCHFSDGTSAPRLYSVRQWDEHAPDRVETWGKFQQFKTREVAVRTAQALGRTGGAFTLVET